MRKATNEQLIESYNRLGNIWKVADELDMCGQSVHERLKKIGIQKSINIFTDADYDYLKKNYISYLLDGKLQQLADEMGRTKQFICRKADELGLTDLHRKKSEIKGYVPSNPNWKKWPHPKGMKNKKHTNETKDLISIKASEFQKGIDENKRISITKKMIETKMQNGKLVLPRQKTTWKSGWREIGGKRKYFRSRWEANYARYLEFLKCQNQIKNWDHESKVFWFEGIKRGCVSYLPDYEITYNDGTIEYHEVKGWMDDRSKTKIKRMSIYYPQVVLKIISKDWFKENAKKISPLIKDWEF